MGFPKGGQYRYLDPKICPSCGADATTVFGARRYCTPCSDRLEAFMARQRAIAEAGQ